MNEEFDPQFEKMRLDKLASQCLSDLNISGEVIFDSITGENQPEAFSWYFNDGVFQKLSDCGYKSYLLGLIEGLSIYRLKFNIKNYREGIVSIEGISTKITWLPDGHAETLREERRQISEC